MNVGTFSEKIFHIFTVGNYSFNLTLLNDWSDSRLFKMDSLITGKMNNDDLQKCPKLKNIFIPFTGRNGFDEGFMNEAGITLHSTNAHSKYVAERAFTLALTLLGKITEYDTSLKAGKWSRRNFDNRVSWNTLFEKKVGIYGYGTIGKWITKMLDPFDCKIHVYNRSKNDNVNYVDSLEDLVSKTDIIFISVPLNKETESSFNKHLLENMHGKFLINIARGNIVNEDDLYTALKNDTLQGYASDVWYNYPKSGSDYTLVSKYPLHEENVVMTPHCGGFAHGSEQKRYIDTLNQIESLI